MTNKISVFILEPTINYLQLNLFIMKRKFFTKTSMFGEKVLYGVKKGTLEKLGTVEELEHITGDVYKAGKETLVIKENKISVLSDNSRPMPVRERRDFRLPECLRDFSDICRPNEDAYVRGYTEAGKIFQKYINLLSDFFPKDCENFVENAVVLKKDNDLRIFIRNEDGNYVENKNFITLPFATSSAFIYEAGLYIQDPESDTLRFVNTDFRVLAQFPAYFIFWAGKKDLFAMELNDDDVSFRSLGSLEKLIKTDVSLLLQVENQYGNSSIFHLRDKIDHVLHYDSFGGETCSIDQKTGMIEHKFEISMDGVEYPEQRTYELVHDRYQYRTKQ